MQDVAGELALYLLFMTATTSILSLPLAPATLLAAKLAPPWAVATIATSASIVSACFDHWFVRRAFRLRVLESMRTRPLFVKAERWAKVAPFWTIAGFAGLPLPFILMRVLMPLSGYPMRRYATATALGRFPRFYVIAACGAVVDIPDEVLVGLLVAGAVISAATYGAQRLGWIKGPLAPYAPGPDKLDPEDGGREGP